MLSTALTMRLNRMENQNARRKHERTVKRVSRQPILMYYGNVINIHISVRMYCKYMVYWLGIQ